MTLHWVGADLLTGDILADLAGLEPQWPLRNTLMTADRATATLYLTDSTPDTWERAVLEGAAFLACYDDADPALPIVWGGYVEAGEYGSDDAVPLNLATFEACLDRVFVGDQLYETTWKRDDILAHLLTHWFTPGCGIPVTVAYTAGNGAGPDERIVMQNTDNASVKRRMDEVCGVLGGEYKVVLGWSADGTGITFTVVIADRIGAAATAGLEPAVTFELPGQIVDFSQPRSYAPDKAGNKVVAYSSGAVDVTNFSTPVTASADGRPTWEFRFQPANAPISPPGLNRAAVQAAKTVTPGSRPVSLKVSTARAVGRRLGVDWTLGDDIGYLIPARYNDEQGRAVKVRCFPNGLDGVGRVIAYEVNGDDTVTPIFAEAAVYQ